MIRRTLLSLTLAIILANCSLATTYYVSKAGNDDNDGTSWSTAWASIGKINQELQGGDTVFFGTGIWRNETIFPPSGATFSDRTLYACSSFVRGIAKIYGGENLTGADWTPHSGSIYKTTDWNPQGCYYDSVLGYGPGILLCLVEDDSLLKPQRSLGGVDGPGKFYYGFNEDILYLWCTDGANPNTHDIEASCRTNILVANKPYDQGHGDYTTFWGFDIRYAEENGIFLWGGDAPHPDSFFVDHCNISYVAGNTGSNNSCWAAAMLWDTTQFGHYNRVRSCSLRYVWDLDGNPWHSKGVSMYGEHNLAIESCYVAGVAVGIDFKNDNHQEIDTLLHKGCVARFNTIVDPSNVGINIMRGMYADSIYGNTIIGAGDMTISLMGINSQGGLVIFNNTIYNAYGKAFAIGYANDDALGAPPPNYIKYNIVHSILGPSPIMRIWRGDYWTTDIDSNCYYNDQNMFRNDSDWYDITTWRNTYSLEIHSDTTDPGFANPENGDFSRPDAQNEMNRTYGGRTWTIFGAWQPDGTDVIEDDSTEGTASAAEIHTYPNSYEISSHSAITFHNLPTNSEITIATVSGTIVRKISGVGPGEWVWDVKNDKGKDLAPGVYLFVVEHKNGLIRGNPIVIK